MESFTKKAGNRMVDRLPSACLDFERMEEELASLGLSMEGDREAVWGSPPRGVRIGSVRTASSGARVIALYIQVFPGCAEAGIEVSRATDGLEGTPLVTLGRSAGGAVCLFRPNGRGVETLNYGDDLAGAVAEVVRAFRSGP